MKEPELTKISIDKIKIDESNPNKMSEEQFKALKKSINKFGNIVPIILDKDYKIADGEHRLLAYKELGLKEVPAYVLDISDPDRRILRQVMNKLKGSHDYELDMKEYDFLNTEGKLKDLAELIPSFDYDKAINDLLPEAEEDDFDVEGSLAKPKYEVKRGDVFKLGNHLLMCGDSTKKKDVERLMGGGKADMVFTDPPYGMFLNTNYKRKMSKSFAKAKGLPMNAGSNNEKVIGDNEDFKPELIQTIFGLFGYCKEIFIWGADYFAELLENKNDGSWIVWDKRSNEDGSVLGSTVGSHFELCWSKAKHMREIVRVKWCFIFGTEKEFDKKRHHPTQKPILLSEWFINKFSNKNNIIVDVYGGSGSTLIACEQTNRQCRMMEISPQYCSVIIERWEKLTKNKPKKIMG